MSVKYDLYATPVPKESSRKAKLHARVVTNETVGTERLAKDIEYSSSLTAGDIKAALSALGDAIVRRLQAGDRVHIEGLGFFQMTISCPPVDNEKEIRAESVCFHSVCFRPEKDLKRKLVDTRFVRSEVKKHSRKFSAAEMDEILRNYFISNEYITRMELEKICRFTQITASRWLKSLVEQGKLVKSGYAGFPLYKPAPDEK